MTTEWRVLIRYGTGEDVPKWMRGTLFDARFDTEAGADAFVAANGGEKYLAEWPDPPAENRGAGPKYGDPIPPAPAPPERKTVPAGRHVARDMLPRTRPPAKVPLERVPLPPKKTHTPAGSPDPKWPRLIPGRAYFKDSPAAMADHGSPGPLPAIVTIGGPGSSLG